MNVGHAVRAQRVIAIVRERSAERALRLGRLLLEAGVDCVEVSLGTPGAPGVISELLQVRDSLGRGFVGVGTVLTLDMLDQAQDAGAEFVVTPNLNLDVVARCVADGLSVFPGVLTPTEALLATDCGAEAVKLFPASAWTPGAVRDLLGALPSLDLVPTGGISLESAATWIGAGAVAVGMGSALTRGEDDAVADTCRALLQALAGAR